MKTGWRLFSLFAAVFAVAFLTERRLVPDVVPIGFAEKPQALWSVETAFVLRAIELISSGVAIIALALTFIAWARRELNRTSTEGSGKSTFDGKADMR
jgi:hypothetical protein